MNTRTARTTVLRLLRSRTLHWIVALGFLVAFGAAFASSLYEQADAVAVTLSELRPLMLAGALVLALVSLAFAATAWRTVVAGMGSPLDPVKAARIYLTGHLGTYLPGTAWPLAIQLHMGRRAGVPPRHIVATFVISSAMLASTGLTVGLGAAPGLLGGHVWWLLAPALFVVGLTCWPDALRRSVAWLLRVLRRPEPLTDLSARRIRTAFAHSMASWIANGLQLWVLAISVGAPPLRSLPVCLGAMALSILLGSLLPTAPGGLGARELVLMVALATLLPTPAALVVVGASRLIHTIADVVPAAALWLMRPREKQPPADQAPAAQPPADQAPADRELVGTPAGHVGSPAHDRPDRPDVRPSPPQPVKEDLMSANDQLVSVIVPNFNGEKTLAACLASVAAQTYPSLELIVVDDASTDRSREIAAGFDCTLLSLPANAGPAVARNRGIAASRGEILFFLDADVALAPDAVITAMRVLRDNPELAGVSGVYTTTPLFDDGPIERYQVLHAHYWRARNAGLVRAGYFSLGAFRREVIEEVGGFDDNLPANFNEDTEYGYRIAQRYPMLLTTGIRGHHDDDDRLLPIMRKFYRRVSSVVPLVLGQRGTSTSREMAHRPREVVAAGLALGLALLAPLAPLLLLGALAALAAFCCADPRMVRFVRREAGLRFLPFFLAVHYVLSLTVGVAAAVGLARCVASPSFRRRYQRPATAPVGA